MQKELCIISDIQVGRFKGNTKIIDSISLNTDLFTELDAILKFIKKNLMVEYIITGEAAREEKYDYPINAIREIVINMLIHRDYRNSSSSLIKIFDDRIEFYNPGKLYGNITIDDLLTDNYTSKPRNKLIARAFHEIHKIERYGSGIGRILKQCKDYGIMKPKFEEFAEGFRVTLFKEKLNGGVNEGVNGGVNGGVKSVIIEDLFKLIKSQPNKRTNELAKLLNIPFKTVEKWIARLRKENKIEFRGSSKTGGYFLKK